MFQFACVDSMVSNESLRYSLDLHKAEIAEILKDMRNSGLLVSKGYGRGTTYHLPDKVASSGRNGCKPKKDKNELLCIICKDLQYCSGQLGHSRRNNQYNR